MNEQMQERIHAFLQHEDNVDRLRDWFLESRLAEEIMDDTSLTEQQATEKLHRVFEADLERIAVAYFEAEEAP